MLTGAETVLGILGEGLTIIAVIAGGIGWLWKKIRKKLVEPVAALTAQVAVIKHEVEFNNGGSVKDAVTRTEDAVKAVTFAVDRVEKGQVKAVQDIESARAERMQQIAEIDRRLDDHIDRHRS